MGGRGTVVGYGQRQPTAREIARGYVTRGGVRYAATDANGRPLIQMGRAIRRVQRNLGAAESRPALIQEAGRTINEIIRNL